MVWIYIAIILCMRVVQSLFTKKASSNVPSNMIGYVKYTTLYQGFAAILALVLFCIGLFSGSTVPELGTTIMFAVISGVALAICCMCSLYALGTGTMVLNSIFGTAGLLVPAIASLFLYDEVMKYWQWIGIALLFVGAYLLISNSKKVFGKFSWKTLVVLLLSLLMNGLTMLMQKMFGMTIENGNVSLFSFVSFASGVVVLLIFLGVLQLCYKNAIKKGTNMSSEDDFTVFPKTDADSALPKNLFVYGILLAVAVFIINQFATMATPLISAVILFALINGGATVISAIVGAIAFNEKLSWQTVLGVIISIGSLIMLQL